MKKEEFSDTFKHFRCPHTGSIVVFVIDTPDKIDKLSKEGYVELDENEIPFN